jgi:hypothetical protein
MDEILRQHPTYNIPVDVVESLKTWNICTECALWTRSNFLEVRGACNYHYAAFLPASDCSKEQTDFSHSEPMFLKQMCRSFCAAVHDFLHLTTAQSITCPPFLFLLVVATKRIAPSPVSFPVCSQLL